MEFWGVEVKPGETLNVEPEEGMILHLSQATLGEAKKEKGNDSILLNVSIGGQKLVIGHLSDKAPHTNHDLVFEKKFDLSHNWKNGSVHFCGYKTVLPDEEGDEGFGFDSDSDDEEAEQTVTLPNGKPEPIAKAEKKEVTAKPVDAKPKVKIANSKKEEADEDDSDEDDDDFDEEDDDSDDEDMLEAGDDSDDDDEDEDGDSSEEEETPKKVEQSKKRPAGSASKTPVPEKKAKLVTPQKTGGDGKKGAHTATPHPSKKAGGKDAPKTPNSAVTCGSCSKSFKSDQALQAHSKAKHSAGK